MLKTIEDIKERLVKFYEPNRIILFGSYAIKMEKVDSDIDIFIIKETEKRPIERNMEAEKILSDRLLPLDIIVYTPEEVRFLYSIGSPFIEEIMEKGRLIYMRKATSSWIKDAEDELESAKILFEHGKNRGACYHSQQCVEKILKALILEKGKKPARIHDIVELFNLAKEIGWDIDLSMDEAIFLNSIYKGRYPSEEGLLPYGEPTKEDAQKAIASAEKLVKLLKTLS